MKNRRFGRSVGKPDNAWGNPTNVPRLEIDETPVFLPASSYPFTFNLKSRVRNFGANSEINILSIKEVSESGLATPWTQANRFLTMDRRGRITYRPKGTYLNNRLIIEFEAADEQHPATNQATQISQSYEEVIERPWGSGSGSAAPTVGTLAIQIQDDVIGDPEKEKQFWERQIGKTCAVTAVASVLRSLGITKDGETITYTDVLNDVVVRVDAEGNIIGPLPPYLTSDGRPQYTSYDDGNGNWTIERIPNDDGWNMINRMLEHYGVSTHTGYGKHFSTLVKEIEAGNKVIAYIDAYEIWNNDYVQAIHDATDAIRINGLNGSQINSRNHAIWITGIDRSDPENPIIIINDSGDPGGRGARYPLEEFLAAWEDSNFVYTATGAHTPDLPTQRLRADIEHTLYAHLANRRDREKVINTDYFYEYIQNPELVAQIEAQYPGTKWKIRGYLYDLRQEEQRIHNKYTLNPATINSFYSNVDVSEWLLQNPPPSDDEEDDDE